MRHRIPYEWEVRDAQRRIRNRIQLRIFCGLMVFTLILWILAR